MKFLGQPHFAAWRGWFGANHAPKMAQKPLRRDRNAACLILDDRFTVRLIKNMVSDLRGQVVMINLWASWCPPCRKEMPAIERVYQDLRESGLEVLAVNTTYQDNEADATAFVSEFGLSFPVLLDRTGAVANRYQLRGLPTTFFVDQQGVIRSVVVGGPMNEALIRSKVQELLGEVP